MSESQFSDVLKQLEPWRAKYRRPAWKPVVQKGEDQPRGAKFGGTPWLAPNEAYPTCQQCRAIMPLFVQLDLNHLPAELANKFGLGLLQLFYCVKCVEGWQPFSLTSLVRIIQPSGPTQIVTPPENSLPAKTIIDWTLLEDYPAATEAQELGLNIRYEYDAHEQEMIIVESEEFGIQASLPSNLDIPITQAQSGDKLAGWPYWIQGVEYPRCPECQQLMQLVMQLDSNDNLPFMFGDVGVGHITQCPEHKHIVAFGWACS